MTDEKHARNCEICGRSVVKFQGIQSTNGNALKHWHSKCFQTQQSLESKDATIKELVEDLKKAKTEIMRKHNGSGLPEDSPGFRIIHSAISKAKAQTND